MTEHKCIFKGNKDLVGDIMKYVGTTILPPIVMDNAHINMTKLVFNKHPSAMDIVLNPADYNLYDNPVRDGNVLSSINDNRIVKLLIAKPWLIDYVKFATLNNDIAVRYLIGLIKNVKIKLETSDNRINCNYILGSPRFYRRIVFRLQSNPNIIAVQYFINNPSRITKSFSLNSNPIAIEYLKNNPKYIYTIYTGEEYRISDEYPKIGSYDIWNILEPEEIKWSAQTMIDNMTDCEKTNYRYYYKLVTDTSDTAVDYVISHADTILSGKLGNFKDLFAKNTNDRAVDFILENYTKIGSSLFKNMNVKILNVLKQMKTINNVQIEAFSNPDIFVRDPELEKVLLTV